MQALIQSDKSLATKQVGYKKLKLTRLLEIFITKLSKSFSKNYQKAENPQKLGEALFSNNQIKAYTDLSEGGTTD